MSVRVLFIAEGSQEVLLEQDAPQHIPAVGDRVRLDISVEEVLYGLVVDRLWDDTDLYITLREQRRG